MKVEDLIIGNTYVDVTIPGEYYMYTGRGEIYFPGDYIFDRVDPVTLEVIPHDGIMCTPAEVTTDILPWNPKEN